jgi:hypothetical protein
MQSKYFTFSVSLFFVDLIIPPHYESTNYKDVYIEILKTSIQSSK